MQVRLQLMLVCGPRQLQLFLAEKRFKCWSGSFQMQVAILRQRKNQAAELRCPPSDDSQARKQHGVRAWFRHGWRQRTYFLRGHANGGVLYVIPVLMPV